MAWKSPVKWRLIFSMGNTCAYPPPAAPPFIPKQGPREGSRSATTARLPIWLRPSARPMLTVVLPIPAFVAVIEVTRMRWLRFTFDSSMSDRGTLATCLPYCSSCSASIPICCATSAIGNSGVDLAISMSVMGEGIEGLGDLGSRNGRWNDTTHEVHHHIWQRLPIQMASNYEKCYFCKAKIHKNFQFSTILWWDYPAI